MATLRKRRKTWQRSTLTAVLGTSAMGVAALGIQGVSNSPTQLEADSLQSAVAGPSATLPPLPSPPSAADLHETKVLAQLVQLRHVLLEQFPSTFGGMYCSNGTNEFVVEVVGAANLPALKAYVESYVGAGALLGQAGAPSDAPSVSYSLVSNSLFSLSL